MRARTVVVSLGALAAGGAAVVGWPRWGPCLGFELDLQLEPGHSAEVGCDGATLTFAGWSSGAEIQAECPSRASARLSDGAPTAVLCGYRVELIEHWVDPRLGADQVRLAVGPGE